MLAFEDAEDTDFAFEDFLLSRVRGLPPRLARVFGGILKRFLAKHEINCENEMEDEEIDPESDEQLPDGFAEFLELESLDDVNVMEVPMITKRYSLFLKRAGINGVTEMAFCTDDINTFYYLLGP